MTDPITDTRQTEDAMVNRIDSRLVLDNARGYTFGAVAGLLIGYSMRETAAKLGLPPTTLTRMLRQLGKKVAHE